MFFICTIKSLLLKVEMTELENLIICKPYDNSNIYEVSISPGNEAIVIYKYNPFGEKFSFNCKIKAGLDPVVLSSIPQNNNDLKFGSDHKGNNIQSQSMFDSQGMKNSKNLKFNTNMRSSKAHVMVSR